LLAGRDPTSPWGRFSPRLLLAGLVLAWTRPSSTWDRTPCRAPIARLERQLTFVPARWPGPLWRTAGPDDRPHGSHLERHSKDEPQTSNLKLAELPILRRRHGLLATGRAEPGIILMPVPSGAYDRGRPTVAGGWPASVALRRRSVASSVPISPRPQVIHRGQRRPVTCTYREMDPCLIPPERWCGVVHSSNGPAELLSAVPPTASPHCLRTPRGRSLPRKTVREIVLGPTLSPGGFPTPVVADSRFYFSADALVRSAGVLNQRPSAPLHRMTGGSLPWSRRPGTPAWAPRPWP